MVSWLLDTNVLSEATRPVPDAGVMQKLTQWADEVALCAPVWHEMRFGWLRMPVGPKRDAIGVFLQTVVAPLPVLPYDASAARVHAELRADCMQRGVQMAWADGQIAGIAMAKGLTLVTRNLKDFAHLPGLRVESWWR